MIHNSQKGIVIYLALITLSTALATALFVAGIFVKEYKISLDVVRSLNAVYVADSIMEQALYSIRSTTTPTALTTAGTTACDSAAVPAPLATAGCFYGVTTSSIAFNSIPLCSSASQSNCAVGDTCTQVVSNGTYGGANRAMEIVYCNK